MDTLIISNENNILHIFNEGNSVDYSFYNCKGHLIDGGVLENENEQITNDLILKEVLDIHQEQIVFSSPYIILNGDRAENLLELIEMEDLKNNQLKVKKYLSSLKEDNSNKINDEIEKER